MSHRITLVDSEGEGGGRERGDSKEESRPLGREKYPLEAKHINVLFCGYPERGSSVQTCIHTHRFTCILSHTWLAHMKMSEQ